MTRGLSFELGVATFLLLLAFPWAIAAARQPAKTHVILVKSLAFAATPDPVHVGDTIIWVNRDLFRHTATARDGSFDLDLPPDAQARTVVKKIGVLNYYCRFHPGMTGKIVTIGRKQ